MVNQKRLILVFSSAFIGMVAVTLIFILLDLLYPVNAGANGYITRYVRTNGSDGGGNDCTSSAAPCRTVQHAVSQSNTGDEVLVATGIYTGVQARNNMTQVVYISKTVTLRGGYSNDYITYDPQTYPTTLDAQGEGRVVTIIGIGNSPLLEGLTLTGGNAHGNTTNCPNAGGVTEGCGGGIFIYSASPTIANNTITHNVAATSTGNNSASGGGIEICYASHAVITGNLIISNTTSLGARGRGGGLDVNYSTAARIEGNQVLSNVATTHASLPGWGGGIAINSDGSFIQNNVFQGNRDNSGNIGSGAGLYSWNGSNHIASNLFTENHGQQTVFLGYYDSGTFEANQITNNDTQVGVYIVASYGSPVTLTNNIVAQSGDKAIMLWAASSNLLDSYLLHNTLVGSGSGSGVYVETGYVTALLTNTIITGFAWGITNTTPVSSSVFAEHTLFWGNTNNGILGNNPIYGDPRYTNPANYDYHLGNGSAAIDSGIEASVLVDIDGNGRPIGLAPDIGADEAPKWIFLPLALR